MVNQYNVENAVIGCVLLSDKTGEIFGEVTSDDFTNESNRELFCRLKVLWDLYGELDMISITDFPESQKKLAVICAETVPALSQWKRYTMQLREQTAKFNANRIALEIGMGDYELEEIQEKAEMLIQVANGTVACKSLSMKNGVLGFMKEKSTPREYIKTGYPKLDEYTYIDKGDYIVIGGRPSAGKTAFSITLLLHMAQSGKRVLFFSLETSPKKIMDRIITSYCGLNFGNVKRQTMDSEWQKVADHSDALAKLPIDIIAASGKSVAWMQAETVRRKADVVVIDYLGLIPSEGNSRYEKMTNVSINLHNFSQQTGVVVIALSQLSRNGAGKEPSMEDLRESGQIEQDADLILLLHNDQDAQIYKVILEKNKEGECGVIKMDFNGQSQQFVEW